MWLCTNWIMSSKSLCSSSITSSIPWRPSTSGFQLVFLLFISSLASILVNFLNILYLYFGKQIQILIEWINFHFRISFSLPIKIKSDAALHSIISKLWWVLIKFKIMTMNMIMKKAMQEQQWWEHFLLKTWRLFNEDVVSVFSKYPTGIILMDGSCRSDIWYLIS